MIDIQIEQVTWHSSESALRTIREQVFMQEQQVPEELEWDGLDETAIHLLATDNHNHPVGCVRILSDGHIGRMAVLKPHRGRGVGRLLLQRAIEAVRQLGLDEAFLDAQCHATRFYEKQGFELEGAEFLDAGIPHRHMRLPL